jgi:hypothetical protein
MMSDVRFHMLQFFISSEISQQGSFNPTKKQGDKTDESSTVASSVGFVSAHPVVIYETCL